jgi:hypothetical protein
MAFEKVHPAVDGCGEIQLPFQQAKGPQASAVEALGLTGQVVVDILRLEHGATLLVPLLFPQPVLDAPLAIPQPFLYPALHLKYLRAEGMGDRLAKAIPSERPRYFESVASAATGNWRAVCEVILLMALASGGES